MAGRTKLAKCAFSLCKAYPWVAPTAVENSAPRMIETHRFVNPHITLRSFNCPASLMYWPLSRESAERLVTEMFRIMRAQAEQAQEPSTLPANFVSTPDGVRCLQCDGMHYPGHPHVEAKSRPEGNRTQRLILPNNDEDPWQIGGRADEDIIPDDSIPQEGIVERRPLGFSGTDNSGGTGMDKGASVAGVQAARVKGQEAAAQIGSEGFGLEAHVMGVRAQVEQTLDDAITMLKAVMGQGESEKLGAAINELANARDNFNTLAHRVSSVCGDVRRSIMAAEENENEFIRVVSSI